MPEISGVLETSLYVGDVARSASFYRSLFEFEVMIQDDRFCAMNVAGKQVLLLFRRGAARDAITVPGGVIPGHDGSGETHFAFAIPASELDPWEQRLAAHGVAIESRVEWERGGHSLYFRDPDSHLVELATPGLWPIY
jgi:catechol 2,3-dioxygenase-like lactoylglutathione lyase family enzyme